MAGIACPPWRGRDGRAGAMSLDVYLEGPSETKQCRCQDCGNEHTREYREEFFSANITHNLAPMARAAGIYEHLWRPEEIGITRAQQLIEPLETGLSWMKADSAKFEAFNSPNGWGLYKHFVPWVEKYLAACKGYPEAEVRVSR
jgi:hypothetical protein